MICVKVSISTDIFFLCSYLPVQQASRLQPQPILLAHRTCTVNRVCPQMPILPQASVYPILAEVTAHLSSLHIFANGPRLLCHVHCCLGLFPRVKTSHTPHPISKCHPREVEGS